MKYLIWKEKCSNDGENDYAYDDNESHVNEKQRHCDCTCCETCSKYYKDEYLNVLCTGDSYAELFDGDVPRDPIRQTIEIDHSKYVITKVSCIENDMIEVSAKKSGVKVSVSS